MGQHRHLSAICAILAATASWGQGHHEDIPLLSFTGLRDFAAGELPNFGFTGLKDIQHAEIPRLALVGLGDDEARDLPMVSFMGLRDIDAAAIPEVAFVGLGDDEARDLPMVSFMGLRDVDAAAIPQVAFVGLGDEAQDSLPKLLFVGWDWVEAAAPPVAFQGWSSAQTVGVESLAFSGWELSQSAVASGLGFEGCASEPPSADIAMQSPEQVEAHFNQTDTHPQMRLEGNWLIGWEDALRPFAYAILSKGGEWECIGQNGCDYQFVRDPAAPWTLDMWARDTQTFRKEVSISENGRYEMEYYYGVLGDWGGFSTGQASGSVMSGQWEYGDEGGREIWTRIESRITQVAGSDGQAQPYGAAVRVEAEYIDERSTMRGNRPSAYLQVLGDELLGRNRFWIPNDAGIEITRASYLCKGNGGTRRDGFDCMSSGGVAGMEFELTLWSNALPGRHYLYFDTFTIPFELELSGFDEVAQYNKCGL
jgi:hypothetical protein